MIVIDASLALDLALVRPQAPALLHALEGASDELSAPELIDLEFLQALRRQLRLGRLDRKRADQAIELYESLPIQRFPHGILRRRIWSLRDTLTAYDAAYFALAEMLDAPLWTRDAKFADAPWHQARVHVI